jgi:site-specific recombinase XerD
VRKSIGIYNYDERINGAFRRIETSTFSEEDKQLLSQFHKECIINRLSKARIAKYFDTLRRIATWLNKPFQQVRKEDVMNLVQRIESNDYSDWTKHDYKLILKIFYRWLRKTEDYPEEVRWVSTRVKNNHMLPEEILTEDDVQRLIQAAMNTRDKALILVLYESGCRIGEILSLRLKNVQFDEYGAQLIVYGKTGMRRVRIISSAPKLALWIDNHPSRDDPEAPLWISFSNKDRPLMYSSAKTMLKKVADRSGIKKRVYPHLFRHSRATHLSKHLTEAQLKQHFGWNQSSRMASIYVHLSGRDIDAALLAIQGIRPREKTDDPKLKVVICSRCGDKNSPSSKFCNRCGSPLNTEVALELDDVRKKADRLMSELVRKPEVLEVLLNALKELEY